jgi:hypothetical protein
MWQALLKGRELEDIPGFDEFFESLMRRSLRAMPIEKRLALLTPEQCLAGLTLEQRLAGLTPEQRLAVLILGLPLETLRALPEDHIRTLAPDLQQKIQQRLQEETH